MHFKKYYILLSLIVLCALPAYSQDVQTVAAESVATDKTYTIDTCRIEVVKEKKIIADIEVHFQLDKHNIVPEYMGNDVSLQNFSRIINSIEPEKIDSVVIISQSSPEGRHEYNAKLSKRRADTMRSYIHSNYPQLEGILFVHPRGESWGQLRKYILSDPYINDTLRNKAIEIIDADINMAVKKRQFSKLPIYKYLHQTYYPRIRSSRFRIYYYDESYIYHQDTTVHEPVVEVPDTVPAEPAPAPSWCPRLHFKSNALGLSMGISNAAVEIDFAKHWSFTFPLYYSAWNYFNERIKFRTLAFQPEVRYWFSEENNKFFLGAHFSYAQYNIAVAGGYRYQDHNMEKPALGGGISVGYRLPLSKDHRWNVEFTLGAGVYPLHYDIFENTPDTKDGLLLDSRKMTYWGLDNAGITFSYALDLKKKGGKK